MKSRKSSLCLWRRQSQSILDLDLRVSQGTGRNLEAGVGLETRRDPEDPEGNLSYLILSSEADFYYSSAQAPVLLQDPEAEAGGDQERGRNTRRDPDLDPEIREEEGTPVLPDPGVDPDEDLGPGRGIVNEVLMIDLVSFKFNEIIFRR